MSELMLTYRGAIQQWHCDHMGHMNVMWYVGKFDEATWHLFAELGLTSIFLKENNRGLAALEQQLTYKSELHAGDAVSVYSTVLEIKDKTIRFEHEMRNDGTGKIAATTALTGVYFDTVARKSCPWPDDIKHRVSAFVSRPPTWVETNERQPG
ncbi:MAG TPA: thioesterase family protein [Vicinamibacterales bacterium]|jgi:acyl-CoA thioester hydrolase|nr:thioesterase family protein [Vicinamibacterales bacterium]